MQNGRLPLKFYIFHRRADRKTNLQPIPGNFKRNYVSTIMISNNRVMSGVFVSSFFPPSFFFLPYLRTRTKDLLKKIEVENNQHYKRYDIIRLVFLYGNKERIRISMYRAFQNIYDSLKRMKKFVSPRRRVYIYIVSKILILSGE